MTATLTRQVTEAGHQGSPAKGQVSWLLRADQGRAVFGTVMAASRNNTEKRRLLQSIAGVFPCQTILHRWGKAPTPQPRMPALRFWPRDTRAHSVLVPSTEGG